MLKGQDQKKYVRTIAVASGKGGVGKTNVTANLAISLHKLGKKVMIVDGDLGLSNIDVLLHLAPKHTIQNLLEGDLHLKDVLIEGPHGIKILPAGSGVQELTALNEFQRLKILEAFDSYSDDVDVLLIDTAAGISENVAFFCIAAQEIVIVTSPEPTAITDAYALIKVLSTRYQEKEFHVLVNSVKNSDEAVEVFRRLSLAADKFLNISLDYLGYLPYDESVQNAVREQQAFVDLYPNRPISRRIMEIAQLFLDRSEKVKGTLQFFIGNLLSASSVVAREKALDTEPVVER
ncbi:MAG: MinD/ParA family protein [Nitrospirae bacterium]|nr:MinD/ParA family protein [Nitrospirota bacterium]NTW67726.1 MinD/ParA family protein [Nitrospirota bacterium]